MTFDYFRVCQSKMTDEEVAEKINQAISTGEQFSQRYYKILDQERHKINSLYHEEAVLAWNGTAVEGIASIKTFLMDKLPKTNTFLNCLDAQPVHDSAVAGQITILVTVSASRICLKDLFYPNICRCPAQ